jgi:hypothetical protein
VTNLDVHLAEYTALKAEQNERVKSRDGYMYSTLAVVVAAVVGAAQANLPDLLLAVPPACAVLGWTRLRNDALIVEIRRYLRDDLRPHLQAGDSPVLGWETGPRGRLTRRAQFAADLLTFVAPAVIAVIVWGSVAHTRWWGWVAAIVGSAITGVLVALIARHALSQDRGNATGIPPLVAPDDPLTEPGS